MPNVLKESYIARSNDLRGTFTLLDTLVRIYVEDEGGSPALRGHILQLLETVEINAQFFRLALDKYEAYEETN